MAMTFKDFFLGLGEAAPAIANTIHNYTMLNYQRGIQERELDMREAVSGAQVQYYTGAAEKDRAYGELLGMQKNEVEMLLPIKVGVAQLQQETAAMLQEIQTGEIEAIGNYEGGAPKYFQDKISLPIQTMRQQNALINKQMSQIDANILSQESERTLAFMKADVAAGQFTLEMLNTLSELTATPGDKLKVEKIFNKYANESPDGSINWQKMANELISDVTFTSKTLKDTLVKNLFDMVKIDADYKMQVNGAVETRREQLMNTDELERVFDKKKVSQAEIEAYLTNFKQSYLDQPGMKVFGAANNMWQGMLDLTYGVPDTGERGFEIDESQIDVDTYIETPVRRKYLGVPAGEISTITGKPATQRFGQYERRR